MELEYKVITAGDQNELIQDVVKANQLGYTPLVYTSTLVRVSKRHETLPVLETIDAEDIIGLLHRGVGIVE